MFTSYPIVCDLFLLLYSCSLNVYALTGNLGNAKIYFHLGAMRLKGSGPEPRYRSKISDCQVVLG